MDATTLERRSAVQSTTPAEHVKQWLRSFEKALAQGSERDLKALFADDCHWRDLLAFTWNITPHDSISAIVEQLVNTQPRVQAKGFSLPETRTPPRLVKRLGAGVIEAIFEFETSAGRAEGAVRLLEEQPGKAWVLMSSLKELKGHEEPVGARRPSGAEDMRMFGGPNWADRRTEERLFRDREPAVLIVGAGQAGLAVAARLRLLRVDALVVDSLPRVGDVWRTRYHALALHNQVSLNHLPYLPFPPSWPKYLPKDMVGQWLETYAEAMECNVWTETTLVSGTYDEKNQQWQARVRRADGSERVLRPRHIVFANGVVGAPARRLRRAWTTSRARSSIPIRSRRVRPGAASAPWCWAPAPAATTSPRTSPAAARRSV